MSEAILFAGPTAWGIDVARFARAGVRVLPPARRGDVERLVASSGTPGVAIICDGVFQAAPAVSHAELCGAIDGGWQVWGVSSLGAIRAHELRHEGMRGFGQVHAMFERFDDFTDDEMCLLHFPEPPYFPVSEPLVNLRYALEQRAPALGISERSSKALLEALGMLWFGDRTLERFRELMVGDAAIPKASVEPLLDWLKRHRLKTMDLEDLLSSRPWRQADTRAETP